jgi:predicted transposase YbfD/YdcC
MHWAIENGLHHCLDVTFREDASTVRLRNATANFATLRRWNPDYLFELLQLTRLPKI